MKVRQTRYLGAHTRIYYFMRMKNFMPSATKTASLLFISLFVVSCLEDLGNLDKIGKITLEPDVAFPLIGSDFTFEEFLKQGQTQGYVTNVNGLVVLTYKDTIVSPTAEAFFSVPDQQSPKMSIAGSSVIFPTPGSSVTVNQSSTFVITPSQSEQLDSIVLKAGQLLVNIQSSISASISLTLTVPSLKKGSALFQQTFTFSGNTSLHPTFDIAGYRFDLTESGTTTNTISFSMTAVITDTGQPIGNTSSLDVDFQLSGLKFSALFGQLGTTVFQTASKSMNTDIFDNVKSGTLSLQSPSVEISVDNSFGLPVSLDIQQMKAVMSGGSTIALSGAAVSPPTNPYLITAPVTPGGNANTTFSLTSANSNISQIASSLPHDLVYQFSGQLNPGNAPKNFVLDTSRLMIGVDFQLPLYGQLSGLAMSKTYDFNGIGIDNIEKSVITVKTINEFPLDAYLQVYFVNSTGATVDSLFADNKVLIKAAPVDGNGISTSPSEVLKQVTLDKTRIEKINTASFLTVGASINTTNNGTVPVKITFDTKLKVNVGVNTHVQYSLH